MPDKRCPKCSTDKPTSEFTKNRNRKDGLSCWCRDCANRNTRAWFARHPDYINQWRIENPDKIFNKNVKRRGYKKEPLPEGTMEALIAFYGPDCMAPNCDRDSEIQMDHVIPLALGGEHAVTNLQLLCKSHNSAKGNRNCADYRDHSRGILTDADVREGVCFA